jgi:hypothetical protein
LINILSIRCGLAFGPYLEESAREFLDSGSASSRVVRQGGSGLIIRSDEALRLRYQHREAGLAPGDARHYQAALGFRREFYDLRRMSDEIVLGSVNDNLLLSHPQSELWLDAGTVSSLLDIERGDADPAARKGQSLPDWLTVSTGAGRLLLSDQRNGRWVLLGGDHLSDIERRSHLLVEKESPGEKVSPPTILMRGLNLQLQSAFNLASVFERFAESGDAEPYEESFSGFHLRVARSSEGIEVSDGDVRVGMNAKDTRKWAAIIRGELERLNASQRERGNIRTVFADSNKGRWVLQWGDEVFLDDLMLERLLSPDSGALLDRPGRVVIKRTGDLLLLLDQATGSCIALDDVETAGLVRLAQGS